MEWIRTNPVRLMEGVRSKPLFVAFRRLHSTKHPTCSCAHYVNGTVWTCSNGVARLIDHKEASIFRDHHQTPASFVSSPIPDSLPSITSVTHSCCGEGTFLRVELCQRSSYSLRITRFAVPFQSNPRENPPSLVGVFTR